jgi:uncharacterized protein YbjT (DUF2867 family)
MNQKLNVIITGATGMVGEGVMHQCLQNENVVSVLLINRKPYGLQHPKLKEIIHQDFYNLSAIESELKGYNACYFCLGISSVGMSREEYYKITYTLTMHVGETLSRLNPDMVFTYVSGMGTDSNEKGNGWASVKGKTENDLKKLPFKKVYAYRPGFIKPIAGLKNAKSFYKYINWMFPIGKSLSPNAFNSLKELGDSMIYVSLNNYDPFILNGKEISATAKLLKA